jgi:hypothetical protein
LKAGSFFQSGKSASGLVFDHDGAGGGEMVVEAAGVAGAVFCAGTDAGAAGAAGG